MGLTESELRKFKEILQKATNKDWVRLEREVKKKLLLIEQYESKQLLKRQNNKCATCKKSLTKKMTTYLKEPANFFKRKTYVMHEI